MSLADCIQGAVLTGKMTQEQADELQAWQADYERALISEGGFPSTAAREADKLAVKAMRIRLQREEWLKSLQLISLTRLKDNVLSHPNSVATGVMSVMSRDLTGKAKYANVDYRAQGIRRWAQSMMTDLQEALHPSVGDVSKDILGVAVDRTRVKNVIRELSGVNTGDSAAKLFSKQWAETAEQLRLRFNKAGGDIKKLDNWMVPQFHYDVALRKAKKPAWIETIQPLLDRKNMLNDFGNPMTDAELGRLLDKTYDRIVTHGLVDLEPGVPGSSKLANTRQEQRILLFKDADAWLTYAEQFGQPDIYHTMVNYVDGMSHDIAMLEVMGPNPEQAYNVLKDMARKPDPNGKAGVSGTIKEGAMDALWDTVSGKVNHVGSVKVAAFFQGVRNTLTSAKLGGAAISAISDLAFLQRTSAWAGIPAYKVFKRELALLSGAEQRAVAGKLMLGNDVWSVKALAGQRFTEITGTGVSAQLADVTMRISGLTALTDAGKTAFGMELASRFAQDFGKSFDQLGGNFRKSIEAFGFTDADWAIMRSTNTFSHKGATFFDPSELMKRTDISSKEKMGVLNKYLEFQSEMQTFAVPEPDARSRAIATLGMKRGTAAGEAMRSLFQFKGFPTSVILTHFYRGMYETGMKSQLNYIGQLAIGTTVMGLIALEAKEILKGNEPRPITIDNLGAAFLQGGGAGIMGDFLHAGAFGSNRYGQDIFTSLSGPMVGLAKDVTRVTLGQVGKGIEGEDINFLGDLARTGRRYVPIASSLWYTRLLFDRAVFDQLELLADPKAPKRFRQAEQRQYRDFGNRPYFPKGKSPFEAFQ